MRQCVSTSHTFSSKIANPRSSSTHDRRRTSKILIPETKSDHQQQVPPCHRRQCLPQWERRDILYLTFPPFPGPQQFHHIRQVIFLRALLQHLPHTLLTWLTQICPMLQTIMIILSRTGTTSILSVSRTKTACCSNNCITSVALYSRHSTIVTHNKPSFILVLPHLQLALIRTAASHSTALHQRITRDLLASLQLTASAQNRTLRLTVAPLVLLLGHVSAYPFDLVTKAIEKEVLTQKTLENSSFNTSMLPHTTI